MTSDRTGRRPLSCAHRARHLHRGHFAFTLVEMLSVVAIIALLIGILLPMLVKSKRSAYVAVCLTRQGQIGEAVFAYAVDHGRRIPYGPDAPPGSLTNFYPRTGVVTSLISLENGNSVGLGLMLEKHMSTNGDALFCPGADQPFDAAKELAKVGKAQSQSSYFYRHGSGFSFAPVVAPPPLRIDQLGLNRSGKPIRALAIDTMLDVHPNYLMFGIYSRTHHRRELGNALYTDGHAQTLRNDNEQLTVPLAGMAHTALSRILEVLEFADSQ